MQREQEVYNEIPKTYDPKATETKWYARWEREGFFHAEPDPHRESFCIVIPPPNVTGSLHMGHALDDTMQDILIRWRRMQGYAAMWIPGTDHAGIATQIKVEQQLAKEGTNRHEIGREAFLERVWDWKEKYGSTIIHQLKKLGASCDWDRLRFTMDPAYSKAVREVFVRLYEKGLIYQGDYIINWCPRCNTALSDLEVEHEEKEGRLWHLRYPLEGDEGFITVATTRPETMLGDTAVAVNPEDERYVSLHGRMVRLPLVNRAIPIIADAFVDPDFGTGMVKVTPAHDPNDFEMGRRHGLPFVKVIGFDAHMTDEAGAYAGMDRYECRKAVVEELERQGLLASVETHTHSVGHCQRCGTTVEPLLSKQWFVRMKPLAEPAVAAVRDGRIRFVPERFSKNYLNWVENVRDWCISRQLWWGHRIPVWTCEQCSRVLVQREDLATCPECGSTGLQQDPDVLDTWFSSALWPFSTQGWPEETAELKQFYPTSVLVTGFDIIYFWVARMVFMGLEFMGDVPFRDVLIHGLLRDALGRKMSKSLGTGVDPLEVIEEFGADALRFTLVTGTAPGNDMRWHPEKVEASRNFANKIWNAARFAMMNLDGLQVDSKPSEAFTLPDRWILSRLNGAVREVSRHLERYDLGEGARTLNDFFWSEFCDWYIEMAKPRLQGREGAEGRQAAQWVTWRVLETALRLLHPYMPFLTEEIWQRLPHEGETILLAPWPLADANFDDADAESQMALLMETVKVIRNIRTEKKVQPGRRIPAFIQANPPDEAVLRSNALHVSTLAGLSDLEIGPLKAGKPEKAIPTVAMGVEIYLPLAGLLDVTQERSRLEKELEETRQAIERAEAKLQNEGFVSKAPATVVVRERETLQSLREKYDRIQSGLAELR